MGLHTCGMHKSILWDAGAGCTSHTRILCFCDIEVLYQRCSQDGQCCQIVNCMEHVVHFGRVHFFWANKEQLQSEKNCSLLSLHLENSVGIRDTNSQCKRPGDKWKLENKIFFRVDWYDNLQCRRHVGPHCLLSYCNASQLQVEQRQFSFAHVANGVEFGTLSQDREK